MRLALVLLFAALTGCAQVGQFTAQDATDAKSIATAVGDTAVNDCYDGFAKVGAAVAAVPNPGPLAKFEEKRAARAALSASSCNPIYADVLAEALKATALAPLIP